ncbi:NAD(P)H-binding protein [Pareuzebyella sediminis]|uniref:NAD(P)H-binding protein n=1 Tax=Pareuzebyella sediminis TaxID=2607998 RepID=UPI0011EBE7FC|nr:NAD(P)H-binding protein [Pareuzebyella sediminis]
MDAVKKTAIVLGATGLTGGKLLELLLEDERYGTIKLFSRSSVQLTGQRIMEYTGDLTHLERFKNEFTGDEVYCCIGTTKSKTPNTEVYRAIDYGIPVSAARLCKENKIDTFIVISALGANPKSSIFYNRTKGEMEDAVLQVGLPKTHLMQPSLISGKRKERRIGEWFFKQLMRLANFVLVGPLKKYRSIRPETIARAMVWLANHNEKRTRIPSDQIKKIALQ